MNPQDFFRFADSHRSIRNFTSQDIAPDLLDTILGVAQRSSSAGNLQSWSVVETRSSDLREKLYFAHSEQKMILQAPVVLTFCSDFNRIRSWVDRCGDRQSFDDHLGFLTGLVDSVIASQTCALGCEASGLGICYMGTTLWNMREISEILKLPKYVVPVTSLVVGYPNTEIEVARKERLPLSAVVHRETYQDWSPEKIDDVYANVEGQWRARVKEWGKDLDDLVKESGAKGLAGLYTADNKYPKSLHVRVSKMIKEFLSEQGFDQED